MVMLRSFIETDVYRVMLGSESREQLLCGLQDLSWQPAGEIRRMRRDDGSGVYVAMQFIDGAVLEQLSLRGELLLMQVDNISARLRVAPSLPGGSAYAGGDDQRRYGYAA
jgi:hypothetical protein